MLQKTVKRLISHSMIYSLTWISGSAASILLLPIYTRYLAPADYGILEMLGYSNDILRIIMIAGLQTGLSRFYHGEDNEIQKKIVVVTGIAYVAFSGITGCAIGWSFNSRLSELILGDNLYSYYINLSLGILLLDLIITITMTYFVVAKKPVFFIIYSITRLLLSIGANLYFIVVLKLGALGMLYGNLFSFIICGIILTSHTLYINGIQIDTGLLKKMMWFGAPMIPAMLCATVMHNADRFLIRQFGSLASVGIYSLGYKFPYMLNALVLESFNRVWTGSTMYELAGEADSKYQYARVARYFMLFYVFAQFSLSVSAIVIVKIFAAPDYFSAHQVIPLVSLGLCFHAFYTFFNLGAFLNDKTWLLNLSYAPAAAINITGNIVLLPKYGFMAAAWMTVVTYAAFSLMTYFACKRTLNIPFEFRRLALLFFYAVVLYLISATMRYDSFILELCKGVCFSLIFLFVVIFGGCISQSERTKGCEILSNLLSFRKASDRP